MRNLKKVLSMTLALVMMLGMMTFAGAAEVTKVTPADLTDMKDVVNKEQVSLLVDLGVLNGIKQADGTYKYVPKDTINRASYAKMVYTIMMGDATADVYKGVTTGLKDVAGHWAEGYIGYCVTTKLAVGDGNGSFNPDANITTVSAAKMLLVALGYDAKASGYEGDALWSINIMRDAQKAGLVNNVDQKASENLTRDNAAQMIYNALFARTVVPDFQYDMGVKYLNKYDANATTLGNETYKLFRATMPVDSIDSDGTITVGTIDPSNTATGNAQFPADVNALTGTSEMLGNTVAVYYKANYSVAGGVLTVNAYSKLYTTLAYATGSNVIKTITDGTNLADMTKVGGKDFVAKMDAAVKFFENGNDVTATYDAAHDPTHSIFDDACALRGIIVELINNDSDSDVEIVKVTRKTMAKLTADSATKAVTGADTQVKVPGVISGFTSANTVKTVVGYEGLKKDDVVLYVKIGNTTYIEKAASINGAVTATKGTGAALEVKVNNEFYSETGLAGAGKYSAAGFNDFDNTYTFFLDNGKGIVFAKQETAKTTGNYGVLTDIALVASSGTGAKSYVEGVILFTDGTTKIVKIATIDGVKAMMTGVDKLDAGLNSSNGSSANALTVANANPTSATYYYTNVLTVVTPKYFGAADTAALTAMTSRAATGVITGLNKGLTDTTTANTTSAPFAVLGDFYEYTVNADGDYELKSAAKFSDDNTASVLNNAVINNGKALFDGASLANNETVFVYSSTDAKGKTTYTTYTGINNAPSTIAAPTNNSSTTKTFAIVKSDAGIAKFVYVSGVATTSAKTDKVYITSAVQTVGKENGVSFTMQDAIINGVAGKTIKLPTGAAAAVGLYDIQSVDANGINYIYGSSATTGKAVSGTGVKSSAAGALVLGDNTGYTWNSDTVAYIIESDDSCTEVSPDAIAKDATDLIYVIHTNNVAEQIYVVKQSAESTSITLTAGSPAGMTVTGAPAADVKAGTAAATGWITSTADKIIVTVADHANTTSTITINGVAYTSGTTYTVAAKSALTVTVTVTDSFGGATEDYTYTIAIS